MQRDARIPAPTSPRAGRSPLGAFLGVSLAAHGVVFGASVGLPAALRVLHALGHEKETANLNGDTFAPPREDDFTVEAPESDPGSVGAAAEAPAGEAVTAQATPAPEAADGVEHARAPSSSSLRAPRPTTRPARAAAAEIAPTPGEANGTASGSALYGAVGERAASDLPLAFTRAFPQASSTDPAWARAPLGAAGAADVTISLDDSGHIESVSVGGANGALASGISRTMSLLRARAFTAHAKVTRIHLSARISPDQVHDGLHGDVFAIGQSFYGRDGNAFFALAVGRRIDVKITAR